MLVPVIISGGSGSRLWPVSREARPKPFMQMKDGKTLLQSALLRSARIADSGWIVMVTNHEYYFQSKEQLDAITEYMNGAEVSFLLEPVARNTAAAITMSALLVQDRFGPDAVLMVLPSDHLIDDLPAFVTAVDVAKVAAQRGDFVTFGITPILPETGYGYIECGQSSYDDRLREVLRFVEKPDYDRARAFLQAGNYLWNSGMFCFCAGAILDAIRDNAPEIFVKASQSWHLSTNTEPGISNAIYIEREKFPSMPSISIDYAVMERVANIKVVPSDIGWTDIGSWRAMSELLAPDAQGNKLAAEAILVETRNTYIQGDNRVIAAVGVDNLVIVDTPDALLVGHRDKMQMVKDVVDCLKLNNHEAARWHRTVHRPWGTYTVLEDGRHYKMKRIVVKPGASLSLQMHKHRSEHWVVVSGIADIVNGDRNFRLERDQSTYIPAGNKHRLSNPGNEDLLLIEVQTGDYLGEDDIVRYEDQYGR